MRCGDCVAWLHRGEKRDGGYRRCRTTGAWVRGADGCDLPTARPPRFNLPNTPAVHALVRGLEAI